MPRTQPGRWSVRFLVAWICLMAFFFAAVAAGQRGGDEFFDNLWLATPIIGAWLVGAAGFATGITAIVAGRERAPTVLVSTVVGFLVTAFGVAEVVFPH